VKTLRVLVVDDDEDVAASLAEYLELDGFDVDIRHTGTAGRDTALAGGYDQIIMDVSLPDISGIDCMTCHTVHELGNPLFRSKTKLQGDKLCTSCHEQTGKVGAHAVHSFGNCVNCHMPRIAKSAESGDIRSHVFDAITPKDGLAWKIPNSCQICHQHKDEDPEDLQKRWDDLTERKTMASK